MGDGAQSLPAAKADSTSKRRAWWFIAVPLLLTALAVSLFAVWPCKRHFRQVCLRCGMVREKRTWLYTPDGSAGFVSMHSEPEHTLLSRLLLDRGLVASHAHMWKSKGGAKYFFGRHRSHGHNHGVARVANDANSQYVASFVEDVLEFVREEDARVWVAVILSPDGNPYDSLRWALADEVSFPQKGFRSKEGFLEWWREHSSTLARYLGREVAAGVKPSTESDPR